MSAQNRQQVEKTTASVADRILIAVFALLLCLPVSFQIAGWKRAGAASDEKRNLAPFPKLALNGRSLQEFPRGFDAWFTDHFGMRNGLIRLHSFAVYFGFNSSPSPKVIVGNDGWLFYNSASEGMGSDSIGDYRGTRTLSPAQLESWRWTFQDEHDFCAAHGVKYFVVLVPAKEAVYPEHTPGWMTRLTRLTALEQLTNHLHARLDFPLIDLTPALTEAKKRDRTYFMTDTHWTDFGAYIGWRTFMPALTNAFPAIRLPPDSDFTVQHAPTTGTDLVMLMSLSSAIREDAVHVKPATPREAKIQRIPRDLVTISSNTAPGLPRAVIFHDSFTEPLVPYLSEHFSRAIYVQSRLGFQAKIIQREKPDLVLHITGDRMLRNGMPNPDEMREQSAALRFARATNFPPEQLVPSPSIDPHLVRKLRPQVAQFLVNQHPRVTELGPLKGDTARDLPVLRLDITLPERTYLQLLWRDSNGVEQAIRTERRAGRQELHFTLTDPGTAGPYFVIPGNSPGTCTVHAAEARYFPR